MQMIRKFGKAVVLLLAFTLLTPLASSGESKSGPRQISASGVVKKQGITTYMYGTHVLRDEAAGKLYALRSSKVDLDKYVGQKVTVTGCLVPGYPVEGGPDYLEVSAVKAE